MRKFLLGSLIVASAALVGGAPAYAGSGGMGDPSTHMREMNAICEMQRRGEGPLSPNMCLEDYPIAPGDQHRAHSQN